MRMLLKRAQGNGHEEGENGSKWKLGKKAELQMKYHFSFFLSPCSLYRSPFPSLRYVQTDAIACNRLCKWTQNVTSSHPTMLCAFARGLRACLHGVGVPQVGEVTRLGGVTRLSIWSLILIWSRLHDRWGDPPRRVTRSARPGSPFSRGQILPCKRSRWGNPPSRGPNRDTSNSRKIHFGGSLHHYWREK